MGVARAVEGGTPARVLPAPGHINHEAVSLIRSTVTCT